MSALKLHPQFAFQRWVAKLRPVRYAKDADGDEVRHPKGTESRADWRAEDRRKKRERKREATRTRCQRSSEERHIQRQLAWLRLSPDERERRVRRLPKGAVAIATKSPILVPDKASPIKAAPEKKQRGFIKRASGLFVPGGSR